MIVHLTHALILTQFEADLLNTLEWDEIIAQDFTVHALYCSDTNEILFHSDNQNSNPTGQDFGNKQNHPTNWKWC